MYAITADGPGGALAVRIEGRLTVHDIGRLTALLEGRLAERGGLRLLIDLSGLSGVEAGAWLEDVAFGLRHMGEIARMAVVGDRPWLDWWTGATASFFPGELQCFPAGAGEAAWNWLNRDGGDAAGAG